MSEPAASPSTSTSFPTPVLRRPHRRARGLSLTVKPDGAVVVSVGRWVGEGAVARFVDGHRDWIARTRARLLDHARRHPPFDWGAGGTLPVLGAPAEFPGGERARLQARKACAARLEAFAAPLFARHEPALGRVARLRIGEFRTQWGSCTAAGVVALDWRLALAPPDLAEYVVVHELAHLTVGGHPPKFWRLLEAALPGAQDRRRALRRRSRELARY